MSNIRILMQKESEFLLKVETRGLSSIGHKELLVEFHRSDLTQVAEGFLRYVSDYLLQSRATLRPDETMLYGYWLTKFKDAGKNKLETWEYNSSATEFIKGGTLTLQYWKDQHSICEAYATRFEPPRPDQLSVISHGVLEGLPVQGVRYPSPDHMSGWWITTDQYDGDIKSLKHEHTYHITDARPDLAKYIALPPGFRFDLSSFEDVWFEEEVTKTS
jgi:hypothetical protein